jgi:hypothetical protein
VNQPVILVSNHLQVLNAIVRLIAVDVMNVQVFGQWVPKVLLNNGPMQCCFAPVRLFALVDRRAFAVCHPTNLSLRCRQSNNRRQSPTYPLNNRGAAAISDELVSGRVGQSVFTALLVDAVSRPVVRPVHQAFALDGHQATRARQRLGRVDGEGVGNLILPVKDRGGIV